MIHDHMLMYPLASGTAIPSMHESKQKANLIPVMILKQQIAGTLPHGMEIREQPFLRQHSLNCEMRKSVATKMVE